MNEHEHKTEIQQLNEQIKRFDDDKLEEFYRQCLIHEMKRDDCYTKDAFNSMKNEFERVTNPRAGFAIMERYISGEIARRWRRQRDILKDFKGLFV